MNNKYLSTTLGGVLAIAIATTGCATKKHVREAIAPVQNQVNTVQKQTTDNKTAIGDLDRNVAAADEKATDAGKRANQASQAASAAQNSANTAQTAAGQAQQRADAANQAAQQVGSRLDQSLQNLDNYRLVDTKQVYFRSGRYTLDKKDQADLDAAAESMKTMRNYVIEVQGYADRTGSKAVNEELSRKRADAVVRYLSVNHDVPLRDIRELGVGSDFPNAANHTRADRKNNRRVDVKIYALDVNGTNGSQSSMNQTTPATNTGQADRMKQPTTPPQP